MAHGHNHHHHHHHTYCSKCGRHHGCRHRERSDSPSSDSSSIKSWKELSRTPSYTSVIMQANHTSLLGLDPGFLRKPRYHGAVYNVGIARNYTGSDSGSVCVMKWVRRSHRCFERDHLGATLRTIGKAAEIIWHFLRETDAKGWTIVLNKPRVVLCDDDGEHDGKTALMEPYISKFTKFNCNSGWTVDSRRTYAKMLQALSHYSYVWSGGKLLLCDLQGGVREDDKMVILSDPAILTLEGKVYGCSDTGKKGIRNFFYYHECNEYCEHLTTPNDKKLFFRPIQSTITTG